MSIRSESKYIPKTLQEILKEWINTFPARIIWQCRFCWFLQFWCTHGPLEINKGIKRIQTLFGNKKPLNICLWKQIARFTIITKNCSLIIFSVLYNFWMIWLIPSLKHLVFWNKAICPWMNSIELRRHKLGTTIRNLMKNCIHFPHIHYFLYLIDNRERYEEWYGTLSYFCFFVQSQIM